jgi:putative Ca2+/H+ antiporter (TMEM165/GDT1 family)
MFALGQPAHASSFVQTVVDNAQESGLVQSYLLIFISEIGDKTFFIAGLLAAKYGRLISFTGSIGALAIMTVISTVLGQIFHAVPASITQGLPLDDYVAVAAFTYFGIKTLLDASKLEEGDSSGIEEEKKDAEEAVAELTDDEKRSSAIGNIIQTFSLVFAAEIGDKSFLSTIALSAALNPYAIALAALLAHASATGVAVIGGAFLSKYLSEKVIGYIGGRQAETGAGTITDIIDKKAATTGYEFQLSATGAITTDTQTHNPNTSMGTFTTLLTNGTIDLVGKTRRGATIRDSSISYWNIFQKEERDKKAAAQLFNK